MSNLKKIRVQHVERDAEGQEIKTDVDVLTDAEAVTMDGEDLKSGVAKMIDDRVSKLIDNAPENLDTLREIATELEKNQSGVSTIIKKLESKAEKKDVADEIAKKVDKINGKGLSTNDFTNIEKNKLKNIEDGAEKNKVKSVNGKTGDVVIETPKVDLSDYAKKSDTEYKAGFGITIKNKTISVSGNIKKPKIMTAVIDQSNSNPLTCITYEDDAKTLEKGSKDWDEFFGAKLVLLKGGKEVRELKDTKEELDAIKEADGDVMVKFKRMGLSIKHQEIRFM